MSVKNKEDVFPMLVFYTSIFLYITICETAIVCPNVSMENGSSRIISCKSDRDISDFYWYRGHYRSIPILILDSEGKGGAEYGSDHFDISSNGSMILKDVMVEHESYYTFVGFYENGQSERAMFVVNVTNPRCPLVHGCEPCIECELFDVKRTGTLTCAIEGARPLLPLAWNITSKKGIDFVRHHSKEGLNPQSNSWDTSISLDYTIEEKCGVSGEIKCFADDPANILQSRKVSVSIKTDSCQTAVTADDVLLRMSPVLIIVLCLAAGIVVVCFICMVFASKRYGRRLLQETPQQLPLLEAAPDSTLVKELIQTLKDKSREKFCHLQPLPWGEKIDIERLYTESLCKVTTQNRKTFDVTSTKLTKIKDITGQRLVTFLGEHGDGRTTFFKNIVYEWSKGMEEVHLVIFIPLKDVKADKSLSKYLIEDILNTNKVEIALVEAILKSEGKHCLVILDGLEDLSESFGNDKSDLNTKHLVTIAGILQGLDRGIYRNFHVWISSREEDLNSFPHLKHHVKVEMKGFSIQLLNEYIKKCCWHYFNNVPGAFNKDLTEEYNDVTEEDNDLTEEHDDVNGKVKHFFEENNILEDYGNRPLLINLMVHILAMNFTSGIANLPKDAIKNTGELVHVVVQCMKARHKNKYPSFSDDEFSIIENKLGQIAIRYKTSLMMKTNRFWAENIGEENVKSACKIGLLKLIKDSTTNAKLSGIEFYHQRIQEYLAVLAILKNYQYPGECEQIIKQCTWDNNCFRLLELLRELNDLLQPSPKWPSEITVDSNLLKEIGESLIDNFV